MRELLHLHISNTLGLHFIFWFNGATAWQVESNSIYATTTEEEKFALTEFRELVIGAAYREFMQSDSYLIRWLQQTNFNVEESVANFEKFLEWRKLKTVDSVFFEDFTTIEEEMPISFNTIDNDGRPVVWAPVGRADVRKIVLGGAEPLYQRYVIRLLELCEHLSFHMQSSTHTQLNNNLNVSSAVLLVDLVGFNLKTVGCFHCVKIIPQLVSTFDSYYPGLLYKIYFINTPAAFKNVFNFIVSFLSRVTRDTIVVYGFDMSEWMPELHAQFPLEQLPVEYGGSRPSFLGKVAKGAQLRHIQDLVTSAKEAATRDFHRGRNSADSEVTLEVGHLKKEQYHNHHHHHHFQKTSKATKLDSWTTTHRMTCFCIVWILFYC